MVRRRHGGDYVLNQQYLCQSWYARSNFPHLYLGALTIIEMAIKQSDLMQGTQYADIVSYLLQLKGMPAGTQPLRSDLKQLERLRIAGLVKSLAALDTSPGIVLPCVEG
jgi:hypothetical protein